MLRGGGGGGVCVEGPSSTNSLPCVSPRIRALQDRLMDSLPADGAWECLSPAQREAILSLHHARITRNITASENADRSKNNADHKAVKSTAKHSKQPPTRLRRYGKSRAFEEKVESETDDSGVRVASGGAGTNSSSATSNSQNSHEDDSSDPGIKRGSTGVAATAANGGRFAKASSADRQTLLGRKEVVKSPHDPSKRKSVTNGVGNVNKMISKQLNRSPAQPIPSNVTLDCRNLQPERRRIRVDKDPTLFEGRVELVSEHQKVKLRRSSEISNAEGISRRKILHRYQDNPEADIKAIYPVGNMNAFSSRFERSSEELCAPKRPMRRQSTGVMFSELDESDRTTSPSSIGAKVSWPDTRTLSYLPLREECQKEVSRRRKKELTNVEREKEDYNKQYKMNYEIKIKQEFNFKNKFNRQEINKYSSNWNEIFLNKSVPIKKQAVVSHAPGARFRASAAPYGKSTGNLVVAARREDRNEHSGRSSFGEDVLKGSASPKKYARSKSLDRKYLADSSDEESDFEVRRRTERMRRYARGSVEWDIADVKSNSVERQLEERRSCYDVNRPKSKSSWDITRSSPQRTIKETAEDNCFSSRSNILDRWKSQDGDLSGSSSHVNRRARQLDIKEKERWRRRSCDFELDLSDGETPSSGKGRERFKPLSRREWQRRSCDFELDAEGEDEVRARRSRVSPDDRWQEVQGEKRISNSRNELSSSNQARIMYSKYAATREALAMKPNHFERRHGQEAYPVAIHDEQTDSRVSPVAPPRYRIPPENSGRKWVPTEENPIRKTSGNQKRDKEKGRRSPLAIGGKLRLIKSILSF